MALGPCPEELTLELQVNLLWSALPALMLVLCVTGPLRPVPRLLSVATCLALALALVASGIPSAFYWSQGSLCTDKLNLNVCRVATSANIS